MADKGVAVGIDLGTTYSCVGVFMDGKVEIIPNDQGNWTTPSYVSFTDSGRLVGDAARNQGAMNPSNTVFDSKRLIGRNVDDKTVQSSMKHWPFKVVSKNLIPKVQVKYKGESKVVSPEEISAMVLIKMKEIAEAYLGQKVTNAVISVPAYFNDSQRQATKDAGKIAGLNVLLLNEPLAAAIAYRLDTEIRPRLLPRCETNVLIVDLGGGTFDVSLFNIAGNVFKVKATAGDTHLGGEDFNNRLVDHFVQEFEIKYKKDITTNKRSLWRLRLACESAKRELSSNAQAKIELDSLIEGIDYSTTIKRSRFEELCEDLFRGIMDPLVNILSDANLEKSSIHEIVLIGGSTRIPMIQKRLSDFFYGKELYKSINPDEAVAYGAAVQAAILNGDTSEAVKDMLLLDIAPLSLSLEAPGEVPLTMIRRGTRIPYKHTGNFIAECEIRLRAISKDAVNCPHAISAHTINSPHATSTDAVNCRPLLLRVYEGERALVSENNILGTFELPLAAKLKSQIELTFDIDANGLLNISAIKMQAGKENKVPVTIDRGRLSKNDIERMVSEAEQYKHEDEAQQEKILAKNALENYAYNMKAAMEDERTKNNVSGNERTTVVNACNATIVWLENNNTTEKDGYEHKKTALEKVCRSLISRLYLP